MSKVCEKPIKVNFIDSDRNPLGYTINAVINVLEIISAQFYNETKRQLYFRLKSVSKNKGKFEVTHNKRNLRSGEQDVFTIGIEDIEIGTGIYPTEATIISSSEVPLNDDVKFARPIELECSVDKFESQNPVAILKKRVEDVKDLKQMFVDLFNKSGLAFVKYNGLINFVKLFKYKIGNLKHYLVCYDKETKRYIIIGHEDDPYSRRFEWFIEGIEHNYSDVLDSDSTIIYYADQRNSKNVFDFVLEKPTEDDSEDPKIRTFFKYDPVYFKIQLNYESILKDTKLETDTDCSSYSMFIDIPQEVKDKTLKELQHFEKTTKIDVSEIKEAVMKSSNQVTMKRSVSNRASQRFDDCISMVEFRNSKHIFNRFKFEIKVGYKRLLCVPIKDDEEDEEGRLPSPKPNPLGYIPLTEVLEYYMKLLCH